MRVSAWEIIVPVVLVFMTLVLIYTNYALPSAQNLVLIPYNLVAPLLVTFLVSKHYGAIWTTRTTRKIQHSITINSALKNWQGTLSPTLVGVGHRSADWKSGVGYRDGKFAANRPSEPSEQFSGLVSDHLRSGYRQVWKEWDNLKTESWRLNGALAEILNRNIDQVNQDVSTILENTHGELVEPDLSKLTKDLLIAGMDNALGSGTHDIIEEAMRNPQISIANPPRRTFYVRWKDRNTITGFPTPEASAEACRQLRLLLEKISQAQSFVELAPQCKRAQERIDALGGSLKEISRDVDAGGMLEGECDVCRKF